MKSVFAVGSSKSKRTSKPSYISAKRNSFMWRQPFVTYPSVLIAQPVGYPDSFYPDRILTSLQMPTYKLHHEALLVDLISPGILQVDDITILSPIRRDEFFTISKSKGRVLYQCHKIPFWNFQMPFYVGNVPVIENGFKIKVKNLDDKLVAMFDRRTMNNAKNSDVLRVWFGDQAYPAGRVEKPPLLNEYRLIGEGGVDRFVIHKAVSPSNSISKMHRAKNNFRYVIHNVKTMDVIGQVSSQKGTKSFSVNFTSSLSILDKTLILGAMFLIGARMTSGIEKSEERARESGGKELARARKSEEKIEKSSEDELSVAAVTTKISKRLVPITRELRLRRPHRVSFVTNEEPDVSNALGAFDGGQQ